MHRFVQLPLLNAILRLLQTWIYFIRGQFTNILIVNEAKVWWTWTLVSHHKKDHHKETKTWWFCATVASQPRRAFIVCSGLFGSLPLRSGRMKQLPLQQKLIAVVTEAWPSGTAQRELHIHPDPHSVCQGNTFLSYIHPVTRPQRLSEKRESADPK